LTSTLLESKASAPDKSFTFLLALTLASWLWPFVQYFTLEIGLAYRYDLKLDGGLLYLLACLLSIVVAIVLSVILISEIRRKRGPANPGKVILWTVAFNATFSLLVTGFLAAMNMFCRVGSCPSPN